MIEAGYSDFDRERFLPEERRAGTSRGEFTRDRARVLHSSALRRLGAKTQVLSPYTGDFARTRLTHSLEVAQIGREMAGDLGLNPDVVDLACLAHDLGHPPFGHNGERALNNWASAFGGFEGNAQTLRLITRIEPKVFGESGISYGLNLTRAALDATCKYPWARPSVEVAIDLESAPKFGYYPDDAPVFNWIRQGAPSETKSMEAQVMDFSDDVAYSVHDFEDAIVSQYINLEELSEASNRPVLIAKIEDWNSGKYNQDQLELALERLETNSYWPKSFGHTPRELGNLKNLTSSLIGSFVQRTLNHARESNPLGAMTRFQANLDVPTDVAEEIAVLKGTVAAFLMTHASRRPVYDLQRTVLSELCDVLLASNGKHLDAYAKSAWDGVSSGTSFESEAARHRVVVDMVASLTDQSAVALHKALVENGGA